MEKIDYGLKFLRDVLKVESLHFGYWDNGVPTTLANLRLAQVKYIDHLIKFIPEGVSSILDVGCGTGVVADRLVNKGYKVLCISPDVYQEKIFKERLNIPFRLTKFEDFDTDSKYDLILMCESMQYLDLDKTFAKCREILNPKGYILTSDYFRKVNTNYYKTCYVEETFLKKSEQYGFHVIKHEDITENVVPTLEFAKNIYKDYALPVAEIFSGYINQEYPGVAKVGGFLLGNKLKKLHKYIYTHTEEKLDTKKFAQFVKYGIYLLGDAT
ncbi:MAG: hypothetical protein AUJ85_05210 [Elusimicrobia bacterium CG1_02_37_114]|nr:MAG: hypothetical protein AUJ85_05210 [Elusimicrobia bacterium CG1_02_37_114]PIV53738.1 MAG: hypothetical protein COS17_02185 [Elusimicrobia bacterium CG02_land_8_20_14_3_00_37_13]PIZ13525.1 MAG: hypothetical protein COY53_04350 [Elusimicrobia bacterium CG_4_10_14_0_8_um_filter_37_32]